MKRIVAAACLLAALLTWPLVVSLGSAGRVDSGDARHGIWNVAWVARALTSDPASLYHANIFHPHRWALAFSESNLVAGILAIPVWLVTKDGLAAANSAIFLSFVLTSITAFLLFRHLTRDAFASALAAVMFAYAPYAFARLAHVQLLMTFGLPWSLLALHRLVERPGVRRAAALGIALWVTALSCGYYGIFAGLAVGWGVIWFAIVRGLWPSRAYWFAAGLALALAAALTMPFLLPYGIIRDEGFARSLDDARRFSADWRAYLASPLLVHRWMLPLLGTWREVLFPGFLPLALAGVAVATSRRAQRTDTAGVVGFYVSVGLLAGWASFGPDAGLYTVLFEVLPFFDMIRAPARFGVLVTLSTVALAGLGLAILLRRLSGPRRTVALTVLVVLTLASSTVGPLPLVDRPPTLAAYERLAQMPHGPVVEFPYFVDAADRHRHTEYMLASLDHWQPLINGYSDHQPPETVADARALARFPDDDAWAVLDRRGARYIVVHWDGYGGDSAVRERLAALVGTRLRVVVDRGDASLFEVMASP